MHQCGKQSKEKMFGRFLWSPKLDKAVLTSQYWESRKKYMESTDQTKKIMRNKEQLEVINEIGLTLETIEDNIQDCYKKLHSIQSQDKEFRVQYLLEMAEKYASENDVTREAAVIDLMYHEELRDTFRKIQEKMSRQKFNK